MAAAFGISKIITCLCFFHVWLLPVFGGTRYTRSFLTFLFLFSLISGALVVILRFFFFLSYRKWRMYLARKNNSAGNSRTKNVMIIGAGGAASRLIEEFHGLKYVNKYNVVVLIDDNKRKHGEYLSGVKIVGESKPLPAIAMSRVAVITVTVK
jgi:FlaA1/EpsC-like NDP-sugar epimerase